MQQAIGDDRAVSPFAVAVVDLGTAGRAVAKAAEGIRLNIRLEPFIISVPLGGPCGPAAPTSSGAPPAAFVGHSRDPCATAPFWHLPDQEVEQHQHSVPSFALPGSEALPGLHDLRVV